MVDVKEMGKVAEYNGTVRIAGTEYRIRQATTPAELEANDLPEAAEWMRSMGWLEDLVLESPHGHVVHAALIAKGAYEFFDPDQFHLMDAQ